MSDMKKLLRQAAKPFLFLLIFIFICAFLAHYLTGDETLLEYARNNPEQAYGTQEASAEEEAQDTADPGPDTVSPADEAPPTAMEDPGETADPAAQEAPDNPDRHSAYTESKNSTAEISDNALPDDESGAKTPAEASDPMTLHPDRTTYEDGFYYEPLTDEVKQRITGISYPENGCTVPYEDLNYVGLKYIDFNGQEQTGELICNKAIAQDMVEIFYELYRNDYRLERVRLIDEYDGDDTASMADNNTSCFNYRVVDGTTNLSKHAYGLAIDVNPYYNPYVVFHRNADGSDYISPPGSEIYADRGQSFAYKIDENDLCYRLFTEHGFTWGGNWNSSKDYQHFQKTIN